MRKLLAALVIAVLIAPLAAQDLAIAIKDVEPFPYCAITHRGPFTDMGAVIGELVGAMRAQGLFPQIRGPLIGIYHNSPGDAKPGDLVWEAGFVIAAEATVQPPLLKKIWEFTTAAVAMHVGPYGKAGAAIARMTAWAAAQGYVPAGPVLERYLDQNPEAVKEEELRTEIWIPVKKR